VAELVVHDLEDEVRDRLEERARAHGVSTEEEIRSILRDAVSRGSDAADEACVPGSAGAFFARTREIFADCPLEFDIPEWRGCLAEPADLS